MEVLGFPNGVCDKAGHGPKLSVGGDSVCVKCRAEAERATRTHIPVVTVEDPGKDAFDSSGRLKPGYVKQETPTVQTIPINSAENPAKVAVVHASQVVCPSLVGIRDAIYRLPMPKSLSQYKRFQKIQQLIDQCLSEEENG